MAKSKRTGRPTPPRKLQQGVTRAYQLLDEGKPNEALDILIELNKLYPKTPEVLGGLVNATYNLGDIRGYEGALQQLSRIETRNPDIHFALADAYLRTERPALALRTFQDDLRRWPGHPLAGETRRQVALITDMLHQQAEELSYNEEQFIDLMTQHDELRFCIDHQDFHRGSQVAEKLLQKYPGFVPALNNLAQIQAIEGDRAAAIQTSLQVLDQEPDNIHALSNLTRLHFLLGHPDEAEQFAQRLKQSQADASDRWSKIADALAILGDDAGILHLYERAEMAGELEPPHTDALFYHLVAGANWRLGKEKQAQKYWQKSLQIDPFFTWSQKNLADISKPVKERSGVWLIELGNWLLQPAIHGILDQLDKLSKRARNKSDIHEQLKRTVEEQYPELIFLGPHMIDRGDEHARDMVRRLAIITHHPDLVAVVKDYVMGKHGSLQERVKAAQSLSQEGIIPPGAIRTWDGEEQRDLMLLAFEITSEPRPSTIPRRAQVLAEQAFEALQDRDGEDAQELLEQAIRIAPDEPSLQNNLAMALKMQGRDKEASQIILDMHQKHPDYFFGIIGAASHEITLGNLDRAHQMIDTLMQRQKLHITEFTTLCQLQIQVAITEGKRNVAESWVEMWENVDPNDPQIIMQRVLINRTGKR
jgi:tetratricopeptide (TPR) repeat protein